MNVARDLSKALHDFKFSDLREPEKNTALVEALKAFQKSGPCLELLLDATLDRACEIFHSKDTSKDMRYMANLSEHFGFLFVTLPKDKKDGEKYNSIYEKYLGKISPTLRNSSLWYKLKDLSLNLRANLEKIQGDAAYVGVKYADMPLFSYPKEALSLWSNANKKIQVSDPLETYLTFSLLFDICYSGVMADFKDLELMEKNIDAFLQAGSSPSAIMFSLSSRYYKVFKDYSLSMSELNNNPETRRLIINDPIFNLLLEKYKKIKENDCLLDSVLNRLRHSDKRTIPSINVFIKKLSKLEKISLSGASLTLALKTMNVDIIKQIIRLGAVPTDAHIKMVCPIKDSKKVDSTSDEDSESYKSEEIYSLFKRTSQEMKFSPTKACFFFAEKRAAPDKRGVIPLSDEIKKLIFKELDKSDLDEIEKEDDAPGRKPK